MGKEIEARIRALENQAAINAGELHALKVIVGSFIATSPFYEEFLKCFSSVENAVEARVLPASVQEEYLVGVRQMLSDVRRALESRQEPES